MTGLTLRRVADVLYPLALLVALVVLWESATRWGGIPAYVLPTASQTAVTLVEEWPTLQSNIWPTALAITIGFLAGVVVGVLIGMLIVSVRFFEKSTYPVLVASQAVPKIALAPIFVVWLGFGLSPRIAMAFLICFFPIVIETVTGMRALPAEIRYVSRCMGLTAWKNFIAIRLPYALPHIFAGLKVAITLAAVGAVAGEFVGSQNGLGNVMLRALGVVDTPMLFAALICLSVLTILMFYAIQLTERLAIPWHVSQRSQTA